MQFPGRANAGIIQERNWASWTGTIALVLAAMQTGLHWESLFATLTPLASFNLLYFCLCFLFLTQLHFFVLNPCFFILKRCHVNK